MEIQKCHKQQRGKKWMWFFCLKIGSDIFLWQSCFHFPWFPWSNIPPWLGVRNDFPLSPARISDLCESCLMPWRFGLKRTCFSVATPLCCHKLVFFQRWKFIGKKWKDTCAKDLQIIYQLQRLDSRSLQVTNQPSQVTLFGCESPWCQDFEKPKLENVPGALGWFWIRAKFTVVKCDLETNTSRRGILGQFDSVAELSVIWNCAPLYAITCSHFYTSTYKPHWHYFCHRWCVFWAGFVRSTG